MKRADFEHVIAAAAQVTGLEEFIVIGSQAILGSVDVDPPAEMLESMEVDMYPRVDPDRADEIDGALGDGSWFEATHGYFAHGVGVLTAKVPAGWEDRLVRVEIPGGLITARRGLLLGAPRSGPLKMRTGRSARLGLCTGRDQLRLG